MKAFPGSVQLADLSAADFEAVLVLDVAVNEHNAAKASGGGIIDRQGRFSTG